MALNFQDIIGADDRYVIQVPVPEWGGSVYLRQPSAGQRDQHDYRSMKCSENGSAENYGILRATLVAQCLCDADGKPWKLQPAQVKELAGKSPAVIDRLFQTVNKMCSAAKGDVEAMVKNLLTAPDGGSTSG